MPLIQEKSSPLSHIANLLMLSACILLAFSGCSIVRWRLHRAEVAQAHAKTEVIGHLQESAHAADLAATQLLPSRQAKTVQTFTAQTANLSDTVAGKPITLADQARLKNIITRLNSRLADVRRKAQRQTQQMATRDAESQRKLAAKNAEVVRLKDEIVSQGSFLHQLIKWGSVLIGSGFSIWGLAWVLPRVFPEVKLVISLCRLVSHVLAPELGKTLRGAAHGIQSARDKVIPGLEHVVAEIDDKTTTSSQKLVRHLAQAAPRSEVTS